MVLMMLVTSEKGEKKNRNKETTLKLYKKKNKIKKKPGIVFF